MTDLQPSGNNESKEILYVETDNIIFVLKGERYGYSNNAKIKVKNINPQNTKLDIVSDNGIYLKEYSNYEIVVQSKSNKNIEFYNDNLHIRNKVTPIFKNSNILSGIINFRGDIGFSDIIIKVDNIEEVKITLEIYPSKISYKEDYIEILRDVNEEIYNLAYEFLARTYLGADINKNINNNDTEFYSILNYVFEKLIKCIDVIINNPNHELQKINNVVKYHSIRNVTNETIKYLEKRPYLMQKRNGRYLPSEALVTQKVMSMDTKENRFVKYIILKITDKINKFKQNYISTNKDKSIIDKLEKFKRELNRRINSSFLKNIEGVYNEGSVSLVFSMGSGYKEVYKYYLMLQKGLSINSNVFSLSIKELSLLYEYWCFIKINSILKRKYNLISSDFFKINRNGIIVTLTKGAGSTVTYENPITKETFKVSYNKKSNSATVPQKPDNILSLKKESSIKEYQFIFDAKYKIDYTENYIKNYKSPGPKEEDINTMHRYRDAIVYDYSKECSKSDGKIKNCVFGAFVLFPYNDEESYKNNKFYKSIEEVNIGGIPFLPSSTDIMTEFLDELINESIESCLDRAIDHIGLDELKFKEIEIEDKELVKNV